MKDVDEWGRGVLTGVLIVLFLMAVLIAFIGHDAYTLKTECEKDLPRNQHCVLEITAQVAYRD